MAIQNTLTKEVFSIDVYKRRRQIEDLYGYVCGTLREWTAEQINYHFSELFDNEELMSCDDDGNIE